MPRPSACAAAGACRCPVLPAARGNPGEPAGPWPPRPVCVARHRWAADPPAAAGWSAPRDRRIPPVRLPGPAGCADAADAVAAAIAPMRASACCRWARPRWRWPSDHSASPNGIGEEAAPVGELQIATAEQFQVGLVHQRGGIQGLRAVTGQLPSRHRLQLPVQRHQYPVHGRGIALTGRLQPEGDVGGGIGIDHGLCTLWMRALYRLPMARRMLRCRCGHRWSDVGRNQRWQRGHHTLAR